MNRRAFIALLGGATAWPLAASAQQPAKLPTIGVLSPGTSSRDSHLFAAFVQRLRGLGWTEGRNVAIEYRWAEGRNEPAEIVAESGTNRRPTARGRSWTPEACCAISA